MKISELKDGMSNVDISGEITEISEPRDVITKFGNSTVATAKIKDESGTVSLSLWGKQISLVSVGDKVDIKGGYTRTFRDEIQVSVGKQGSIQKVEAS
ncbi:MAG: OB-fold nucleic acid binding domain-containing protein [Candidatus Parvarchaeota archaeon]|nr:OB-fold nucleic acid binding domain-containing protein [Candidatus Parvarchaeota archaeon]